MSLESLDKANVQRLVDSIGQKGQKLDVDEAQLEQTLIKFTEFFAKETPLKDKDGKPIDIPYQFKLENHAEFKKLTLPISRALWSFTKVVSHMRQELYAHETPLPNFASALPTMGEENSKGILNDFKNLTKKLYRDPNSPYNATKDLMDYYSSIPQSWINMIHTFEINIRIRPTGKGGINTRDELDRIMNDLVIVFNSHIEPNLVHVVHYANLIIKGENDNVIANILTNYNKMQERQEKIMMGMGGNQQN